MALGFAPWAPHELTQLVSRDPPDVALAGELDASWVNVPEVTTMPEEAPLAAITP